MELCTGDSSFISCIGKKFTSYGVLRKPGHKRSPEFQINIADKTGKVSLKIEIDQVQTTKSVTPEYIYDGLSSSLQVTGVNPTSIAALVSGSASQLAGLGSSEVKVKLNLGPFQSAGTYSVAIKGTDFVLPNGVGLASFLPSAVSVTLENR